MYINFLEKYLSLGPWVHQRQKVSCFFGKKRHELIEAGVFGHQQGQFVSRLMVLAVELTPSNRCGSCCCFVFERAMLSFVLYLTRCRPAAEDNVSTRLHVSTFVFATHQLLSCAPYISLSVGVSSHCCASCMCSISQSYFHSSLFVSHVGQFMLQRIMERI